MPPDQPPLFADPPKPKRKTRTRPPEKLTAVQMVRIQEWAERVVPWLRREALESFESVETYVEECLEYWQGRGDLRPDWLLTIQHRIRVEERRRLSQMAKAGSQSAKAALHDPAAWAEAYDLRAKAATGAAKSFGPDFVTPRGADVIQLGSHNRRGPRS